MTRREAERNRKIAEALLEDVSVPDVAARFGISRQRVYKIAEAEGLVRRWVRQGPDGEARGTSD